MKRGIYFVVLFFFKFCEFSSLANGVLYIFFLKLVWECRVDDLCIEGLKECYFLDFLGPRGFAAELSHQSSCK